MKKLTDHEVAQLLFWVQNNENKNWGTWGNYPLPLCSYNQYQDCKVYIKFDMPHEYRGLKFTYLVSSRLYATNRNKKTIQELIWEYEKSGDTELAELKEEKDNILKNKKK